MSPTAASVLRMFVILGWVPPNILHRIIKGVQRNDAVIFTIFREGAYELYIGDCSSIMSFWKGLKWIICNTLTVPWRIYENTWNPDMCSQRSSLMGGFKDFCRQPSISKYCVPRNFVNTFKNYRCSSPAPLSVFFIQQKQRSLRLSCSLWSIDKWSGVMTLISDLVRSQLCMMEECPCSWWAGATLQLDMRLLRLHSLRCFSLLPGCSIDWNVSAEYPLVSTHLIHCGDCHHDSMQSAGWAELGWAGNMTPWHGYDKGMMTHCFLITGPGNTPRPRLLRLGECWPPEVRCLAVMLITDQNCPQSTATSHSRPRGMCGY